MAGRPSRASAAKAGVAAVRFPFLFWHEDTIVVPMTAGGMKTLGIVDTAAAVSMVDRGLADAAQIEVTSTGQRLAGPGGGFRASRTVPFEVSLANITVPVDWAAVIDLSDASRAMGRPVGFLIGQDILRRYVFDFRFDSRQFSVAPTGSAFDAAGMAELKLARGPRQEPTIPIRIEDNPPVDAVVDSGNSNALLVSPAYADEAHLTSRRSSTGLSATANGVSSNRLVTVRALRMGDFEAKEVPTEIYATWTSDGPPANIGLPLLAGPRLVFDFGQDRLWRSRSPAKPLRRDRSGLGLAIKPDRLVVVHVALGSPAAATGWKPGEEIVEIDGQRVGSSYSAGDLWRWRFRPAGARVRLRTADGRVRQLRLADYY